MITDDTYSNRFTIVIYVLYRMKNLMWTINNAEIDVLGVRWHGDTKLFRNYRWNIRPLKEKSLPIILFYSDRYLRFNNELESTVFFFQASREPRDPRKIKMDCLLRHFKF